MFLKGISKRWFINTIGVVLVVLTVSIISLSLTVQSSSYNGIDLALSGRADELLNVLSSGSGKYKTSSEFMAITRDYIENFPDKNTMEIMALNKYGKVVITSTGFEPDQSQEMPDYMQALSDPNGSGKWVGTLRTGEKAMAITRVVRDQSGGLVGSVRYIVSMEKADRQVFIMVLTLIGAGAFIMLLITFSGFYFIRSIVVPIRQVSDTAGRISRGDFDVRIKKSKDDEIGRLCDAINDMAGELGATERMKNDFISSVSHELRTPLTAIKGWAETLQQGADPVTSEKGMYVIIRESERLSGIVEELLDFSRLQSGRLRLMITKLDVLAELDEAVYMFTDRAGTEHKELNYEETVSLSPVLGDINRLRQVFVNILDNALKYTGEGGVITVSSNEVEGWLRVVVSDTGCGIPAEHLPKVKMKFYKANQLVRGSGIGLAVADEIISLHGGRLDVESREGVGTSVTISLPSMKLLQEHPELVNTPEIQKLLPRKESDNL